MKTSMNEILRLTALLERQIVKLPKKSFTKTLAEGFQMMNPVHQQREMALAYTQLWRMSKNSTKVMGTLSEAMKYTSAFKPTNKG